jgi:hypothetical protein
MASPDTHLDIRLFGDRPSVVLSVDGVARPAIRSRLRILLVAALAECGSGGCSRAELATLIYGRGAHLDHLRDLIGDAQRHSDLPLHVEREHVTLGGRVSADFLQARAAHLTGDSLGVVHLIQRLPTRAWEPDSADAARRVLGTIEDEMMGLLERHANPAMAALSERGELASAQQLYQRARTIVRDPHLLHEPSSSVVVSAMPLKAPHVPANPPRRWMLAGVFAVSAIVALLAWRSVHRMPDRAVFRVYVYGTRMDSLNETIRPRSEAGLLRLEWRDGAVDGRISADTIYGSYGSGRLSFNRPAQGQTWTAEVAADFSRMDGLLTNPDGRTINWYAVRVPTAGKR